MKHPVASNILRAGTLVRLALVFAALLPVMAWAHGEIEGAGEAKTQRIVEGKNGKYRVVVSLSPGFPVSGEDSNLEVNVVRLLPKPDPLLGSEVPLSTKPSLSILEEGSQKVLVSSIVLHDEGEAGVFGIDQYRFGDSGSLLLRFVIHGEGAGAAAEDLTVDFPVSVKTNVAAIFRLWVNLAIAILIVGLTALQLWKIRARNGEAREMVRPIAVGAVCCVAVFAIMNYFVINKVLQLRKAQAVSAPAELVKTNADGSFTIPPAIQKTLGIELVAAKELPLEQSLTAYGAIQAKPDNSADIIAPLWGRIEFSKDPLTIGTHVDKAQELVKIVLELSQFERAPMEAKQVDIKGALEKAKGRRDGLKIDYERQQKLFASNPAFEQDMKWAKELYDEAEDTYQQVSSTDKGYVGVIKFRDPRKTPVYSPIAGTITFIGFTPGQLDINGEFLKLFTITDTSTVWARADVYLADSWKMKAGDPVLVHPTGHPEISLKGTIHWIGDTVDAASRTVPVYADITNPNGELAVGGFVQMEFPSARQNAVAVPENSVVDDGTSKRIYVATGEDKFQPVTVEVGAKRDGWWQVTSGLQQGDRVITKGAAVLGSIRLEGNTAEPTAGVEAAPQPAPNPAVVTPASEPEEGGERGSERGSLGNLPVQSSERSGATAR